MLSRKEFVEYGDWAVAVTSGDVPILVQAIPGSSFSSKDGNFKTDDLIGVRYGGKVFNLTQTGSIVVLHPTAYMWPNVVDFRTQILYQQDIALIQYFLDLKPGSVLIESGTGSGVLTTSLARSVAPHGHVHTFEFHPERVKRAQEDFKNNQVDSVVTCRQRDILERGFPFFPQGVDAAFLDLPAPQDVIPSVDRSLRPQGRICNFSPCIEQVQRVCLQLAELNYEEIFTVEILAKEYELITTTTAQTIQYNQGISLNGLVSAQGVGTPITGNQYAVGQLAYLNESDRQLAARRQEAQKQRQEQKKAAAAAAETPTTTSTTTAEVQEDASKKQKTGQEGAEGQELCQLDAGMSDAVPVAPTLTPITSTILANLPSAEVKFPIQARPLTVMRGHTGYLTFARKRASTQAKEGVVYAAPFGQPKVAAAVDAAPATDVQGPVAQ